MSSVKKSSDLSHPEYLHYSRHLILPEIGLDGQQKLKASSVLVIGTGGLGSPVCLYLAAAGVGRIGVVDYDEVDCTNIQRQILHGTSSVGKRKVTSALERLRDINPFIQIDPYNEAFTSSSAFRISEPYDLIIDATDNFPSRYLINDVCVLMGKPYIYGSASRFEGMVSVFWAKEGPCYRCLYPEPPLPGLIPSCAETGVFNILPGVIGCLQATEALKLLLGIGKSLLERLLIYDARGMNFEEVRLRKNPKCRICSKTPEITALIDDETFYAVPKDEFSCGRLSSEWEIEPHQVSEMLDHGEEIHLIDVREPHELQISRIPFAENIPLGSLASEIQTLNKSKEIILFCRSGSRSARALGILTGAGFRKVKNMRGGINAWAEQVDSSLPCY